MKRIFILMIGFLLIGVNAFAGDGDLIIVEGNVGIGTIGPFSKLGVVNGLIYVGDTNTRFGAQISGHDGGKAVFGSNLYVDSNSQLRTFGTHPSYGLSGIEASGGILKFYTGRGATTENSVITPIPRMTILPGGYTSIYTTLDVGGDLEVAGYILSYSEDKGIEVGCRESTCWTNANGIIGFPGFGRVHGSIAFYPDNNSFALVDSSSGSPSGDYGALSFSLGFNNLWAGKGIFKGNVGIGTQEPTAKLDVNNSTGYNQLRLRTAYTPSGTNDANGSVGDVAWDDNYVYVKTNVGWKRAALSTW